MKYTPAVEQESAIHVWLVLFKAAHAVERNAKGSIAELGLGLSDFAVLELLLHKGPQPVNRIGRKVLLSSGSISAANDALATSPETVNSDAFGAGWMIKVFPYNADDVAKLMDAATYKSKIESGEIH